MSAPLRFYFDYISPYAYLAWTQIHALATRHGRTVEPVPVLFAALLDANGQRGPAEIPRKRIYIFKDTLRTAHLLGVPLGGPKTHPFNPLLALRVSSLPMDPEVRRRLIDKLYAAVWSGAREGIYEPEVVSRIATEVGLDGPRTLSEAATDEAKARVRAQTDELLALGGFGVPSIIVDGELFWGLDSYPHIERRLEGKDPIDRIDTRAFEGISASAVRKGGG